MPEKKKKKKKRKKKNKKKNKEQKNEKEEVKEEEKNDPRDFFQDSYDYYAEKVIFSGWNDPKICKQFKAKVKELFQPEQLKSMFL